MTAPMSDDDDLAQIKALLVEVDALRGERDVARAAVEAVLSLADQVDDGVAPHAGITSDLRALIAAAGYLTETKEEPRG